MQLPDLTRIVEAYVPVPEPLSDQGVRRVLRSEVLDAVRAMQADRRISWFSFLLHQACQLRGHSHDDNERVLHFRFEPGPGIEIASFIDSLPMVFREPREVQLGEIAGIDGQTLRDADWAYAWGALGLCSEWVLSLIECHEGEIPLPQLIQFLHYITNAAGLGNTCIFAPMRQFF